MRVATPTDIPRLLELTRKLHEAAGVIVPIREDFTKAFLMHIIMHEDGLCVVAERDERVVGMLAAGVSSTPVSPVRVAQEHGWYVEPDARGVGGELLAYFERWAYERGCYAVKMSSIARDGDPVGRMLTRAGYKQAEIAWAKRL